MSTTKKFVLPIQGMHCASCAGRVERALNALPEVQSVSVNLASESAHLVVDINLPLSQVVTAIERAGYTTTMSEEAEEIPPKRQHISELEKILISAALTIPLLIPMLNHAWMLPGWVQLLLATPVQFWIGADFYRSAWFSMRARTGNMDLLVTIGTSAAYGLSVYQWLSSSNHASGHLYFEAAAVVITLVRLGKWLESKAKRQTNEAIRALQTLRPDTAHVRVQGVEHTVAISKLNIGDEMVIRPGERIPMDGQILEGHTHVDESMLTGENLPLSKIAGDAIIGGSINVDGFIIANTTAIGSETTLSRIIRAVENAQAAKAPVQRLVDQVCAYFVPTILVIALITLVSWWLAAGDWQLALMNSVAVLVIACPCALGLATPTAIMAGTGIAAKHGILIKDAESLELLHDVNVVAFDKTGTLTVGHPRLLDYVARSGDPGDRQELLALAAAIQSGSEHPLAKATLNAVNPHGGKMTATDIRAIPGRGVTASVDGQLLALGNDALMNQFDVTLDELREVAMQHTSNGETVSWLAHVSSDMSPDKKLIGLFAYGDSIKAESKAAIEKLHLLNIKTEMLTGDNRHSAKHIATALGIDTFHAELMPEEKAKIITQLRAAGKVAMVGDGINDAPALAAADIGIAMGNGTDVAMHTAGITLMRGDPRLLVDAIEISRRTYSKIRQNLFWAFIFNLIGVPLAAFGLLNPMIAGGAMAFSSVAVVSNALLLKRWKAVAVRE